MVDAIDECGVFVLILSDDSNKSGQVVREVERAASTDSIPSFGGQNSIGHRFLKLFSIEAKLVNSRSMKWCALLACALSILAASCATHSTPRAARRADQNAARSAALEWLQLIDAANYEGAFEREPVRFRISGTQKQFVRRMEGRRAPFGRIISRTFIGAGFTTKLVGLPDGNYESVVFKTSFEHKSPAAERVILSKEDDRWEVIDYRIY